MGDNLNSRTTPKSDTLMRVLVLGAIYGAALFFVVALSPSMGFVTPHRVGEIGRVASAPEPVTR